MIPASFFLIKSPFNTEKIADKNAEVKAYMIPQVYCDSKVKMIDNPPTTIAPKIISINRILLLKKIGSISEVKKAPVLIITKATETFDILIA